MMRTRPVARGLTLVELMIVVAVIAVLAMLAAPSFADFMLIQRLKGVNAQLVTDLQFARSEAVARGNPVRVLFRGNAGVTCYSIFTSTGNSNCDCLKGPGAACSGSMQEIRTVQAVRSDGVVIEVRLEASGNHVGFAFDPVTGGIVGLPYDFPMPPIAAFSVNASLDQQRILRTEVSPAGRVTVCAPASTSVGAAPCP